MVRCDSDGDCRPDQFCNPASGQCKITPKSRKPAPATTRASTPKRCPPGSRRDKSTGHCVETAAARPAAPRQQAKSPPSPSPDVFYDAHEHPQANLKALQAKLTDKEAARKKANKRMTPARTRADDEAALAAAEQIARTADPEAAAKRMSRSSKASVAVVALIASLAIAYYASGYTSGQAWAAIVARLPNESPVFVQAAWQTFKTAWASAKARGANLYGRAVSAARTYVPTIHRQRFEKTNFDSVFSGINDYMDAWETYLELSGDHLSNRDKNSLYHAYYRWINHNPDSPGQDRFQAWLRGG